MLTMLARRALIGVRPYRMNQSMQKWAGLPFDENLVMDLRKLQMKCYSILIKYGVGWAGLFSSYFEVAARFRERCSVLLSTLFVQRPSD